MVTGIQMRLVSRLAGVVALPCPGGGLGVGGCVVASWVPPHHHTPTAPHHPLLQGGLCLVQHILPILQPLNLLLLLLGLLALPITNETHGRVFASPPSHALHQKSPRVFTALNVHRSHSHAKALATESRSDQPAPPAIASSRAVMLAGGGKLVEKEGEGGRWRWLEQ